MPGTDEFKRQAAEAAVALIQSGTIVGLGHGSTFHFVLGPLAARLKHGDLAGIRAVAASKHTEAEALKLGIPLIDLNAVQKIDITIDGADEVDPQLNLIKGGGGALMREKIIAQASEREVIVIDESKLSDRLGSKHALPIEVIAFGWERQCEFIDKLGGKATLRLDPSGNPALSDQGNYLLDAAFGPIASPEDLARQLEGRSGIVEHGLFLGLATDVIVAGPSGLRHLKAS